MAEMAQRRRSLPCLLHRPYSDRGDAARHGRRRRVRVPGVSPPAAGALPARAWKSSGSIHLPPAVAAAQYHYLSNWIGGVHVEYMYETDRKAWIRYPPPRWIWRGTAICGVPGEVSRAMLRGWHANNGVALGDLKLGFVCTKQSVDGQDGLEGYYCEYDHPLELDQRLVFARHLEAPLFDPADRAGLAGRKLAKAAAGKGLSQLRDGICEDRRTRDGASVRPRGCRLSAASHRQADRHAVFRRDRAALRRRAAAARRSSRRSCACCSKRRTMSPRSASRGGAFEIRQKTWKLMADVSDYHPACASVLAGPVRRPRRRLRPPYPRASEAVRPAASRRSSGQSAGLDRSTAASPAIPQAPIAPRARGIRLGRGRKHRGAAARAAREMKCPILPSPRSP